MTTDRTGDNRLRKLSALNPSGEYSEVHVDADGKLLIAGTFSAEPPVGGATEAKQDTQITKLAGGLPAALTTAGNLKVSVEEGGGASGLTDTQLRASAVPVSGPLTDTQLRATALPVSLSGVATAAKQDAIAALVGEVQASPTANTLLDRLKSIAAKIPGLGSAVSASALPGTGSTMIVRNYGPNRVFVKRGDNTVTAAATDYPVEAYSLDYLYRDPSTQTYLAAICANSGETATLSINCGEGGV